MTVYIEKPSVNLREELASLRNQGGYEERQFYFDNLVTNGAFDTDVTGWTSPDASATLTWNASGYADIDRNGGGGVDVMRQTVTGLTAGRTYTLKFQVVSASHVVRAYFSSNSTTTVTNGATGFFSVNLTASSSLAGIQFDLLNSSTATASIDNVSVFETDGTDVVHRMPKGWVPLHIFEDGLLQREGAAHDYEVVYDGFDYYVKPAVAPSATTQTCVIGVRK